MGDYSLVTKPVVTDQDKFFFSAGSHQNKPNCVTTDLGTWAVDLNSNHGSAMQALVMSAHAQGKRVHVNGKGDCGIWGDRESVNFLFIVD